MVGEKLSERVTAIPDNTVKTLTQFKDESAAEAVLGALSRFGRANRRALGLR